MMKRKQVIKGRDSNKNNNDLVYTIQFSCFSLTDIRYGKTNLYLIIKYVSLTSLKFDNIFIKYFFYMHIIVKEIFELFTKTNLFEKAKRHSKQVGFS